MPAPPAPEKKFCVALVDFYTSTGVQMRPETKYLADLCKQKNVAFSPASMYEQVHRGLVGTLEGLPCAVLVGSMENVEFCFEARGRLQDAVMVTGVNAERYIVILTGATPSSFRATYVLHADRLRQLVREKAQPFFAHPLAPSTKERWLVVPSSAIAPAADVDLTRKLCQ